MVNMCKYFDHKWDNKVFNIYKQSIHRVCTRLNCNAEQHFKKNDGWVDFKEESSENSKYLFTVRNHIN